MFVFKAVGECIYPVMMGGQKPTDIQQEKYDKLKEVKIHFFYFFSWFYDLNKCLQNIVIIINGTYQKSELGKQ